MAQQFLDATGLTTLVGKIKSSIETSVATKADLSHTHKSTEITDLTTTINSAIEKANHLKVQVVDALPETTVADANTIYLVKKEDTGDQDVYNEYILQGEAFELIGNSKVDLTSYATQTWVNSQINSTKSTLQSAIDGKAASTHTHTKSQITDLADFKGATADAAGTNGLVPAPTAGSQGKFLQGNGTWGTPTNTTYSAFKGASASAAGAIGLVPAPAQNDQSKFLQANGSWGTPANTTYSVFKGATSSADGGQGLVPQPKSANVGQYLKGDGTWGTPTNTTYSKATTSADGLMSKEDKAKLDGISAIPEETITTLFEK